MATFESRKTLTIHLDEADMRAVYIALQPPYSMSGIEVMKKEIRDLLGYTPKKTLSL